MGFCKIFYCFFDNVMSVKLDSHVTDITKVYGYVSPNKGFLFVTIW